MMIPRESAESVVAILENALDDLREAHALANTMSDRQLAAHIEPLWIATANTGGMLGVIYETYPDLAGEDAEGAAERDAFIAKGSLGPETIERIRALLDHARGLLERTAALIDGAGGIPEAEKGRLGGRFAESQTAIRSALQTLGGGPGEGPP